MSDQGTQALGDEPNAALTPADEIASEGQEQQTSAAETEAPQETEKPKQVPWFQRRINELTREKYENQRRAEALEAQLRQQNPASQTQDTPPGMIPVTEVERVASQIAAQREFDASCDAVAQFGAEKFSDFDTARDNLTAMGLISRPFLDAVTALGTEDGAKVYRDLGTNPDLADKILRLPPARMAVEVAKLAAKPAKPAISRAPAPITPVGSGSTRNANPETMGDAEFRAWFAKESELRQRGPR